MSTARAKSADTIIREALRIKDPLLRLARLAAARTASRDTAERVQAATADAIVYARDKSATWPAIGEALGVTPQRAQQLIERVGQ